MKRSEIIKALADNFGHVYEIKIHAETIIEFLESKGVLPPEITVSIDKSSEYGWNYVAMDLNEWEPE